MEFDSFEQARWEAEGWKLARDRHVDRLKGQAAGSTTKRIAAFAWVRDIADEVENAYRALDIEPGTAIGGTILAKQLDKQGVTTRRGNVCPTKLSDGGKAWANALIGETDVSMIDEAVMECRTLMTAQCLSADFTSDVLNDLEQRYTEIIADILALGRRLRNMAPRDRADLLIEARHQAIAVAADQRLNKPPISMASRERYWRDRPPPIRKIFEDVHCRPPMR